MVFHSDDLSSCGSGTGHNGSCIQGLDGEGVDHTNVCPWGIHLEIKTTVQVRSRSVYNCPLEGGVGFTFTGQYISSSQGLVQSNTSTNHSHTVTVRLTHHLVNDKPFNLLEPSFASVVVVLISTLATPTSNFSSGE